jgi:hypothetical protein
MPFDIHKYTTETFWGTLVIGLILLFLGVACNGIRPWWAGCIAVMLICDFGIFTLFAHLDPRAKTGSEVSPNPTTSPTNLSPKTEPSTAPTSRPPATQVSGARMLSTSAIKTDALPAEFFVVGAGVMQTTVWMVYPGSPKPFPDGHAKTKVGRAQLIEFTNLRNIPLTIAAYMISEKTPEGSWREAKLLWPRLIEISRVFVGNDPKQVSEYRMTTFDSAIQDKSIASHETVRGWVFFKDAPNGDLRIEIRNTIGEVFEAEFSSPTTRNFSGSGNLGWSSQSSLMQHTGIGLDISLMPTPDR